jgi:hypothetical protein
MPLTVAAPTPGAPSLYVVTKTIEDAEQLTAEQKQTIIDTYPEHVRDARLRGIPKFGSGLVYPVDDEQIAVPAFDIPDHWAQIIGLDFGWDHPFAASRLAWDKDNDVFYVTACYSEREATPIVHAAAIRPWGDWIPCAWPHDGLQHDKGSGKQLSAQYAEQGLEMLAGHATHEEGGYGVEAGVIEILDRMKTNRFKVFKHLEPWFAEKRLYHREDGLIVKERDDILSSTRVGVMMKRFAIVKPNRKPRTSRGGAAPGAWMA